jgi:hypothetical protein
MPLKWIKLLPPALMIGQSLWYYVYRKHKGWQIDFKGRPRETISHRGAEVRVVLGSRRLLTADSALVEFKLGEDWMMALAARAWFQLDARLLTGIEAVDRRFFIGVESQRFADALIADDDLRAHLLHLETLLADYKVTFQRLEAAGRDLQLLIWVRRCRDLPACLREVIDWLVVFDAALAATGPRSVGKRIPDRSGAVAAAQASRA